MTVYEMHIEVNQRLQEVASYKRDKFLPQEIDLALNKAMYRLLEKGVDSKFQDGQINLSHVSAIIKKNKTASLIKPSTSDPMYEFEVPNMYTPVPPDLYWLINARAEIVADPIHCDTAPTLATTALTEWVSVVPFPAANASAPYFVGLSVSASVQGTLYTAPAPINAGFSSTESRYILIQNILDTVRHATIQIYWERYRDVYYKNSFIFVNPSTMGTVSIQGTGLTTSSVVSTATSYTIYNRGLIASLPSYTNYQSSTKIQEQDSLYSALKQNQFYNTRKIEPVIDQTYDYLIIYNDESFLITRLFYDYIRKPRTISLLLNQSCELASSTHPKIIDLAVEVLRLDTKDQAYPQTVQDTQLRTN